MELVEGEFCAETGRTSGQASRRADARAGDSKSEGRHRTTSALARLSKERTQSESTRPKLTTATVLVCPTFAEELGDTLDGLPAESREPAMSPKYLEEGRKNDNIRQKADVLLRTSFS